MTAFSEIAERMGQAVAGAIQQEWGGNELSIPRHLPDGHALAKVLGADVAHRLARFAGGTRVYVPQEVNTRRRRDVDGYLLEGRLSHSQIARAANVSVRTVRRHAARLRALGRP